MRWSAHCWGPLVAWEPIVLARAGDAKRRGVGQVGTEGLDELQHPREILARAQSRRRAHLHGKGRGLLGLGGLRGGHSFHLRSLDTHRGKMRNPLDPFETK